MSPGYRMNVKKIESAALVVEADLKEMEERLTLMKIKISRGSLSKMATLQELSVLLEIIRR